MKILTRQGLLRATRRASRPSPLTWAAAWEERSDRRPAITLLQTSYHDLIRCIITQHGVPEWALSRKISNGLDLTVVLSRFKNYRQVLELRSWEFSCVGFAFRRCGKFQNVERDRKNPKVDLVKGLKNTWLRSKTTWHTAKPFDPPVLETPPTLDLHCLIRREWDRKHQLKRQ